MDDFGGSDTSTGFDFSPTSIWGEFSHPATLPRPRKRHVARRSDASALPGVAITADVTENEEQRRTLIGILSRFALEREISRTSMHAAQCFVEALPRSKTLPKVSPDGDGGVLFAWSVPGDARTLITVADWMLYAVARAGTLDAQYFEDISFDEGVIPDELLAVISG